MGLGSRSRGDRTTEAIAAFLTEHEICGGGFRIDPPERSTREPFRIDCRGCGESLIRDGVSVPQLRAPSLRVPPWLGDALIWTAILTVAGTLAVGIIRHVDEQGQTLGTPRLPAPVAQEPAAAEAPPETAGGAAREVKPLAVPTARFARRTDIGGLSVGVPSGWGPAAGGGAIGLIALDGDAMLRIFASPAPAPKDFAGGASEFLAQQHPGARVGRPRPLKIGGLRATEIRASYPEGVERALVFMTSGAAYLVLARTNAGAPPRTRSQARRLLRSVKPA